MFKSLSIFAFAACGALIPISEANAASEEDEGLLRDGFVSNLDVIFMTKVMDSDWDVNDNETILFGGGLAYSLRKLEWPIGLQFAYGVTTNEEGEDEADLQSQDLQLGLFYQWGDGNDLRIEAGGGWAWTEVEIQIPPTDIGSSKVRANGVYGRGALRYGLTNWFDINGAAAFHYAPHDNGPDIVNAGGIIVTAGAGIRF